MYRVALGQPALPAARSAARETPVGPTREAGLMTGPALGRIGACVFDAYGTLLDVGLAGRGRGRGAGLAGRRARGAVAAQAAGVYMAALADAAPCRLRRRSPRTPSTTRWRPWASPILPLRARLLAAYRHLAPFRDVGPALRSLREQGMRTAILSNGTTAMLAEARRRRRHRRPGRSGALRRRGRRVQAGPRGLSARYVTARPAGRRDRLRLGQRLGRPRGGVVRPAQHLGQSRPARRRPPAWRAGRGDRRSGGPARHCSALASGSPR